MTRPCAIWNLKNYGSGPSGETRYDSPRAGGSYEITGTAKMTVEGLGDHGKALLTSWLVDQHLSGNHSPVVTDSEIQRAKISRPKSIKERRDMLLRIIEYSTPLLGDVLAYARGPAVYFAGQALPENPNLKGVHLLLAATESVKWEEVERLIEFAKHQGLIKDNQGLSLTFDGLSHLEGLRAVGQNSLQAFVAMWFGNDVADAYDLGIEPAIRDAGYKPMRIDRKEHNNKIDDEIIAEIRRSRFVVADFTCGTVKEGDAITAIPRGGVYYEAGFAQGWAFR